MNEPAIREEIEDEQYAPIDPATVFAKAKEFFGREKQEGWVNLVVAQEQAVQAKMARLKAARLARLASSQTQGNS